MDSSALISQLPPDQQALLTNLQRTNPDSFAILQKNNALSTYAQSKLRQQQYEASMNNVQSLNRNSPSFDPDKYAQTLAQLQQQAHQFGVQQAQQNYKDTGYPLEGNKVQDIIQNQYNTLLAQQKPLLEYQYNDASKGLQREIGSQNEMLKDNRPQLSEGKLDELAGYKNGFGLVNQLSSQYEDILKNHPEFGNSQLGPVSAAINKLAQTDPAVNSYLQLTGIYKSLYAKHIGADAGHLTDFDQRQAFGAMPLPGDSLQTAQNKLLSIGQAMQRDFNNKLSTYQDGGVNTFNLRPLDFRDPSTYNSTPATNPSASGQFQSTPNTNVPFAGNSPTPGAGAPMQPLPDYAQRALQTMNAFLRGSTVGTAQAQQAQAQQAAAYQQQQSQAAQANQQQAFQQGRQAQAPTPPPSPGGFGNAGD